MTKAKAMLKKQENLHIDKSYVPKMALFTQRYKQTKVGVSGRIVI